jgi:hypothetical protein
MHFRRFTRANEKDHERGDVIATSCPRFSMATGRNTIVYEGALQCQVCIALLAAALTFAGLSFFSGDDFLE